MVELTIKQPITEELYYSTCGQIDRHNRCRQESLDIKKGNKYWSKQFNISVFAMNVVDAWLEYQGITRTADIQADFYNDLAEQMINNTYDRFMMRSAEEGRRNIVDSDDDNFDDDSPLFGRINGAPRYVISLHVTSLRRGGRKWMGQKLNTCFKASARSAGRRRHMCIRIVRTPMWSKMKCWSDTLRQTVTVLYSICIAHMTLSAKYIIIKSCFFNYAINASLLLIQFRCFFVQTTVWFLYENEKKKIQLRITATSIEDKVRQNRHQCFQQRSRKHEITSLCIKW